MSNTCFHNENFIPKNYCEELDQSILEMEFNNKKLFKPKIVSRYQIHLK